MSFFKTHRLFTGYSQVINRVSPCTTGTSAYPVNTNAFPLLLLCISYEIEDSSSRGNHPLPIYSKCIGGQGVGLLISCELAVNKLSVPVNT